MYRKDLDDDLIVKKEMGIKDFSLLSSPGVLGNYLECELTHVFIVERKTNNLYHYYAVCSYEEFQENDEKPKENFLTKGLVQINEEFSLGIKQIRLSLEESKDIFNQLCEKKFSFKNHTVILPDTMQLLPKTHVPSMLGYSEIQVNKILKPNFWGDRYILEFINIEKPFINFSVEDFEKINTGILKYLPINLSLVYDRIGSFIFHFPVTLISVDSEISQNWCNATLSMKVHPRLNHQNHICTIAKTSLDDTTTGFNSFSGVFENIELDLGDSKDFELLVFNTNNKIIYKHSIVNFIRDININIGTSVQNAEPRIITHEDGSTTEIELVDYGLVSTGRKNYHDSRINNRVIHNDIINHGGEFKNFYQNERDKALNYIRGKMNGNSASSSEIWLWDPFLRYRDIINTLYYVRVINMPMKCIASFRKENPDNKDDEDYLSSRNSEREKFLTQGNFGINLEFRAVHDNVGFNFHDRFLFFIPKDTEAIPTVYSLGTSVNSLGKSHHLIMQTVYPRNIVKAFDELWKILENDEESLIIKLPVGS